MAGNKNIAMSQPIANPAPVASPAPTDAPIKQPVTMQVAAPVAVKPQIPEVSHDRILKLEEKTRETYRISVELCKATSVLDLKEFGKPIDVLRRINEFALRSSDIAVSGESCVSQKSTAFITIKLTYQQRPDDVFFRAIALMEAEVVGDGDQRARAANAVRRARIETRAEHEVWRALRMADQEKRDMNVYGVSRWCARGSKLGTKAG